MTNDTNRPMPVDPVLDYSFAEAARQTLDVVEHAILEEPPECPIADAGEGADFCSAERLALEFATARVVYHLRQLREAKAALCELLATRHE